MMTMEAAPRRTPFVDIAQAAIGAGQKLGLIAPVQIAERAVFDDEALLVVKAAAAMIARGMEVRHLRMYKVAADREAGILAQLPNAVGWSSTTGVRVWAKRSPPRMISTDSGELVGSGPEVSSERFTRRTSWPKSWTGSPSTL